MQGSRLRATLLVRTPKLAEFGVVRFTGFVPRGDFLARDWVEEVRIKVERTVGGTGEELATSVT